MAGHNGMVGSAILRKLKAAGYNNLLVRSSSETDLREQDIVRQLFAEEKPEYVFMAAAKVGGIMANDQYPADFIHDNLLIETNVIDACFANGVNKLLFLGSSCIYPRMAPQPIKEDYLLTGPLEPTNQAYAVAKIAGLEMCRSYNRQYGTDYLSVMPPNLYGPGDNFDLETSHFLPAMIRKFSEAKTANKETVTFWGTGTPKRELMFVDDVAEACLFLMESNTSDVPESLINIGCGEDKTIAEFAELVRRIVGFSGTVTWDSTKPDGMPQKLLDNNRILTKGWEPRVSLSEGIEITYKWFIDNI